MGENSPRLLLIEDNPGDVRLIREMLAEATSSSFDLEVANRLSAGLACLARGGIDLILVDLSLPDSCGLETVDRAHAEEPDVPIVVLTGQNDEELAVVAVSRGAQDYLVKGQVEAGLLGRAIRYAIERNRIEKALKESNRRLEETLVELERTHEKVLRNERIRALGEMASGIAHNFNNLLTPIVGFTELLLSRSRMPSDEITEYLQMINVAAQDATDVVSGLQEFTRTRESNDSTRWLDLNEVVEQAILLTRPRWREGAWAQGASITVEKNLQRLPPVPGDESEMRQVLTNLILNAVDAMPEGGTLTVRTSREGEYVLLDVTDTGIGMSDEVRRRCLEPFFSTKTAAGTGMGLATVYGIVERHGGSVDVQTEVVKGTTFTIRLPVKAEAWEERFEETANPEPCRAVRVLVVEDDPLVQQVIREYLTFSGQTLEIASSGREGFEAFRRGQFDLVLTDRAMPDMNGDQLAAAIKRDSPGTPVILLTGFGDMMKADGGKPEGVDMIIAKPITLSELQRAMAETLAK